MKMFNMSQAAYAEHRGISPARVSKMIRDGKIPEACYRVVNARRRIDSEKADQALVENLDRIHNRPGNRSAVKLKNSELGCQDQAADFADESVGPWPLWACRYIGVLADLSSGQVDIDRESKTIWNLKIHDRSQETVEPVPWSVKMTFDFGLSENSSGKNKKGGD